MTPIVSSNAKGASHPNHPSAHLETIRRSSLETFQSRLTLWGELRDPSMEPLIYRDTGNLDGAAAIFPDDFE